jgi:hypothetical protein
MICSNCACRNLIGDTPVHIWKKINIKILILDFFLFILQNKAVTKFVSNISSLHCPIVCFKSSDQLEKGD